MTFRAALLALVTTGSIAPTASAQHAITFGPPTEIARNHQFTEVGDAAFGPDNRLAVLQSKDRNAVIVDINHPDVVVAVAGRAGDGPAEFSDPAQLGWIDSVLWIRDDQRPHIELFDRTGKGLASVRIDMPRSDPRLFGYRTPILLRDTALVFAPQAIGNGYVPNDSEFAVGAAVVYRSRRGTPGDSIGAWPIPRQ